MNITITSLDAQLDLEVSEAILLTVLTTVQINDNAGRSVFTDASDRFLSTLSMLL